MIDEDKIMGCSMARYNSRRVYLFNQGINAQFGSKGFWWKLVKYFLKNIQPKTSVFLEVKEGSFRAINLYRKAGFKEIAIRNNYYGIRKNAVIMENIIY